MKIRHILTLLVAARLCAGIASGEEYDFYKNLRYPKELVPGVARDEVQQEGGHDATGYRRRTVKWWPRKGQDIVDIPEGAPLRVWTRNKGQEDKEALAGVCRNWTTSDSDTFKAHLIGLRGFGIETPDPRFNYVLTPAAVLRMENGQRRAVLAYPPFSMMVGQEDHDFIYGIWEKEWKKIQATQSQEEYVSSSYRVRPDSLILETKHYTFVSEPETQYKTLWWMRPHEPEKQNAYRKGTLEFAENMWTHIEAAGTSMPYWRRQGPWKKYNVLIRLAIDGGYAGGGYGACDLRDATGGPRNLGLAHEFYHGNPGGGWSAGYFGEIVCHGGRHFNIPGEILMFSSNFCYPWRNINCTQYQSSLWFFALGDSPNWGYGIVSVAGCLAAAAETTPYHTMARLGQKRGLWKNGIKGFGDFFGEYAARMATCDFVMQYPIRSKYGMPEMSFLQAVYGDPARWRVPNAEAPRMYGFNLVRLVPEKDASEIAVDFHGFCEPADYSDWRACLVAVDGAGRARYSPLWNKGKISFVLKPEDKHLWLAVAATPSALPLPAAGSERGRCDIYLAGVQAPRFPWEVTLTGCKPGSPHRRQGDVINLDELYAMNNGNKYMGYAVKSEVPIPLTDDSGPLAQEKLADMLRRVTVSGDAQRKKIESGEYDASNWWEQGKIEITEELARRIKFLQRNAKGHRHPNGGGFVADNARVAPTAYVGPNAMVLDGARAEDHACIHQHAVIHGEKTVIGGNAKIGGKAWVFGDIRVGGNARILESATVTTIGRARASHPEGQAEITGNAVIKGEHILRLCREKGQVLTGELVLDYTPGTSGVVGYGDLVAGILNLESGVFQHGRIYQRQGLGDGFDAGGLYANWEFDQPKAFLLEDSYVNNNGILHGKPQFTTDAGHKSIAFNGKDQYAEAPPSVADFAEITIDIMLRRTGNNEARIFDFGTGETECFYLAIEDNGKPVLVAKHQGETRRLAASETVPANKWARVRVEINGSAASIYIDAKQVAKKDFKFNPPAVFPGDATEGNFIACGRNKTGFFHGKMDYLRIYRKVHDVFSTLGEVPLPLTQIISKDSCELAQQLSADWQKRRGEKEAEIRSGKYGEMQTEIRQLNERQKTFLKTPKLAELEDRRRQTYRNRDRLHQGIREEFDSLPETKKAGQRLQELRENLKALTAKLEKSHPEVSKLEESVRQTQRSLDTARKLFTTERQTRRKDDFANVAKEITAAEKAIEDEKKRIEREKSKELGEIASRIEKLQQQSNDLWRETLSKAGLSRNPYGGMADVNRMQYQQNLEYHTTADWDERTREEISGKVTPTMKEWLLRVRGY